MNICSINIAFPTKLLVLDKKYRNMLTADNNILG